MKNEVELYINDCLIEFPTDPMIAMNYSVTDLENPTVVRNSFSKTIDIESTPHNDLIFNNFMDLRRINGSLFNPAKKMPFTLYLNGNIIESGYVKLDKVSKTGEQVIYSISLYGGLGSFLYGLQYDSDGNKLKLSDLDYGIPLGLDVDKQMIADAWAHLDGVYKSKVYDLINFAPCYNGIPEDFNANKVLINTRNAPSSLSIPTVSGDYQTYRGWVMGTMKNDMTEWGMRDVRAKLQRPVIRLRKVMEACMDYAKDYDFDLDTTFFNDENKYYNSTWITLPTVSELDTLDFGANMDVDADKIYLTELTEGQRFKADIPFYLTADCLYENIKNYLFTGARIWSWDTEEYIVVVNTSYYVQAVVYDKDDNIVGGSNVMAFNSSVNDIEQSEFDFKPDYDAPMKWYSGRFYRTTGSTYIFNNKEQLITTEELTYEDGMYIKLILKSAVVDKGVYKGYGRYLFNNEKGYWYIDRMNEIAHQATTTVEKSKTQGTLNTVQINKRNLLNTDGTPCDYLLSFLKMFNLRIWKSPDENTIHIYRRENYYRTDNIIDIDRRIDRENMMITPLTYENKWLLFDVEGVDSDLVKNYTEKFGNAYGSQRVDTNYNFDSSTKKLLENNIYRNAVMTKRKSKYYFNVYMSDDGARVPPFMVEGYTATLFSGTQPSGDIAVQPKSAYYTQDTTFFGDEDYIDLTEKPDFTKDNKIVDGEGVILFYSGSVEAKDTKGNWIPYYATDDIDVMGAVNGGESCWILTFDKYDHDGNLIGVPLNTIPVFSRYIINDNDWVEHSLDFGTPQEVYTHDTIDDSSNIYTRYWERYIADMYDDDTRVVEVDLKIDNENPSDMLRNIYFFEGNYWILQKIVDYNVSEAGFTKCIFVKINDLQNYR